MTENVGLGVGHANDEDAGGVPFTAARRRQLFLSMARQAGGVSVTEVYRRATDLGDTATEEAYYNIARRLAHRALLLVGEGGGPTRYLPGGGGDTYWLEEDELAELVDPDYPILALTIWRESSHQINDVPESVWVELRARLETEAAPALFARAITSYCDDFHALVGDLLDAVRGDSTDVARVRAEAQSAHRRLIQLTKYGLGLSAEAVALPANVDVALSEYEAWRGGSYVNQVVLAEELERRIEPTTFIRDVNRPPVTRTPLVGAVDGSTRNGLLSFAGEDGDFTMAHAPLVSINTAIGQINRNLRVGAREQSVFARLPERPEDMQRQDNRHTVMAKLLYTDLSDAEYMHAVWNAMDLLEIRVTQRLLRRWYADAKQQAEVPPADVVLRDGSASPQDRDFIHYKDQKSYGRIVRDAIEASWDCALISREERRTICGVVKQAQLSVFAPVLNWYASQLTARGIGQLSAWPMHTMNLMPDQLLLTRLLTAGRHPSDPWTRTCTVLRPFHAITNYSKSYTRAQPVADDLLDRHQRALRDLSLLDPDDRAFWRDFQGESDAYVKMLRHVQYGSLFLAAVPRLDKGNVLPRLEVIVPADTNDEGPAPWAIADRHVGHALDALASDKFDVAAEHSMFSAELKLDVLPRLLIKAHDTVKVWATELLGRVQEYVGYHLARYVRGKRLAGVQVRPFTRAELEALHTQLRLERERQAGAGELRA